MKGIALAIAMEDVEVPLPRYYYRDFKSGKVRYTRGKFMGWSSNFFLGKEVQYANFLRAKSNLLVPEWCLNSKVRTRLKARKTNDFGRPLSRLTAYRICEPAECETITYE